MRKWILGVLIVSFFACQKAQRDEDTATNTCEDIALAQTIFGDAYKQIRLAALNAEGISDADTTLTTIYGCEEIKVDTLSSTRNLLIDFKYIGCQGLGISRYGRIIADFIGKFGENGSAVDITFSNYFYEDYEVNGSIRIIFKERNSDDKEMHTYYLQNGSVYDGESSLNWTASQSWTVSVGTKGAESFSITGNSNGVNRKGNTFKSEITYPNDMTDDCLYVRKGSRRVEVKNLSTRTLNFGDGTCNGTADVTINGTTFGITVK